jgi:RNA polymerase sigma factor (sigma-70 family)
MDETGTHNQPVTQDVGSDIAQRLEEFDSYIVKQGEAFGHMYACIAHPDVLDLEVKEIIQRVRIKLWETLKKQNTIVHYKSYIQRMVRNAFIDASRRQKKFSLPLILDEYGEIEGCVLTPQSEYIADPASVIEQRIEADALVNTVVEAITYLPERQQYAMVCFLRERVDDLNQLDSTFEAYKLNVDVMRWPSKAAEKQLLKASIPPARKGILKHLAEVGTDVSRPFGG